MSSLQSCVPSGAMTCPISTSAGYSQNAWIQSSVMTGGIVDGEHVPWISMDRRTSCPSSAETDDSAEGYRRTGSASSFLKSPAGWPKRSLDLRSFKSWDLRPAGVQFR